MLEKTARKGLEREGPIAAGKPVDGAECRSVLERGRKSLRKVRQTLSMRKGEQLIHNSLLLLPISLKITSQLFSCGKVSSVCFLPPQSPPLLCSPGWQHLTSDPKMRSYVPEAHLIMFFSPKHPVILHTMLNLYNQNYH